MEVFSQARQYLMPAFISFLTVSLIKMGVFITPGDLAQSLRELESNIRSEYATRRDVEDIKSLLSRLDAQLNRIDERLNQQLQRGGR